MLDPNKSYCTRSGLAVQKVSSNHFSNRTTYPWCAEIYEDGKWRWKSYANDGAFLHGTTEHKYDLIEVLKPMEQPMTLDFTKPETLQRRDGGEFRILATDIPGEKPIAVAIRSLSGFWFCDLLSADGRHGAAKAEYDLIPKPPRVTGWLNFYEMDGFVRPRFGDSVFSTKEEASRNKMSTYKCLGQVYIDSEIQP